MATIFFKKDGKVCYKTEKAAVKDEAEKAKTKKEKK